MTLPNARLQGRSNKGRKSAEANWGSALALRTQFAGRIPYETMSGVLHKEQHNDQDQTARCLVCSHVIFLRFVRENRITFNSTV